MTKPLHHADCYTIPGAALELNVSVQAIRNWLDSGYLNGFETLDKLRQKKWLVTAESVERVRRERKPVRSSGIQEYDVPLAPLATGAPSQNRPFVKPKTKTTRKKGSQ